MNKNKIILLILLLMLSSGICNLSLAEKYSELQTRTTQSAIKKRAIYPSSYAATENPAKSPKSSTQKKQTFGDLIVKMIKILILTLALFFGVAAFIAKHKDKIKNIELPNALKNVPVEEPEPQKIVEPLDPKDIKIKNLVFKFFEINK